MAEESSGRETDGRSRREVVGSLAAVGLAGLAGCGGSDPTTSTATRPPDTPQATRTAASSRTRSPTRTASATETPTDSTTETPTARHVTPGEIAVPETTGGPLRDRVEQVGTAIQPAVVRIVADRLPSVIAGLFVRPSIVVTTASGLSTGDGTATPTVETLDGQKHGTTLLGVDSGDDLAVLRVDTAGPTLPTGSPDAVTPDAVVVHVGHNPRVGQWLVQFGRVREVGPDRFTSSVPIPTAGGPVVTLGGSLVGLTVRVFGTNPAPDETPPPTEPATVYTDRARHEPITDVRRVVETTVE